MGTSAEQLGTDTSKMSDVQVLDFYLKLLIAKDIENQNEQQQTTQPIYNPNKEQLQQNKVFLLT
jgi:hypothetical protein